MVEEINQTYISKETLEKLKKELEYRKNVKRKEIAETINEAKEMGDLSENSEYAQSREDQSFNEGRILELDELIKNALIIEEQPRTKINYVQVGSRVKIKINNHFQEYIIVGVNEADPSKGRISNKSPLGRALLNKKVGESGVAITPKGKIKFKIIEIKKVND